MKRIILTVASLAPEYGGPALSVSRLAAALSAAGHDIALWAPDGSARHSSIVDAAVSMGTGFVRLSGKLSAALTSFGRPDVIHDNGIWLPYNHHVAQLSHQLRIARVVSLHGMLEPWALRYRPLRKKLALVAYQKRDLSMAQVLHATAAEEARNVAKIVLDVPVTVVPNGVDMPGGEILAPQPEKHTRMMLFLSRIHPKKGLPMLIEAIARIRPQGWLLVIAGPDELAHLAKIKALVVRHGLSEFVSFLGPVWGEEKERLMTSADLFVLPTHSENFGIVVAEALAHGVPVLTTKGAPWRLLADEGCGWWVQPTVEGLTEGLRLAVGTPAEVLAEMGRKGRNLVITQYGWPGIAQEMLALYAIAQSKMRVS